MLARLPEYVELGGDVSASYIYVANSHDGSMAVTAAVTPIRVVCANTLGAALRQAEHGPAAQRTFRFRHTGNLQTKFAEAPRAGHDDQLQRQFKVVADRLALEPIGEPALEHRVLRHIWVIDNDTGPRAGANRERAIEHVLAIFRGRGQAGETTGNCPASEWVVFSAIAEHLDDGPATPPGRARCRLVRRHLAEAANTRTGLRGVSIVT